MNVLISLHRGYGLGDSVQMSAVLQHVRKYRPNWNVYYQAEEGKECVGNGIVHKTFTYGNGPDICYDAEVQLTLYDKWHGFTDRPNTRVTSCLQEHFNIPWDKECGGYEINISREAYYDTLRFMFSVTARRPKLHPIPGVVAVHYQGNTLQERKNLTNEQALSICEMITKLGRIPLLIDWNNNSPLHHTNKIPTTAQHAFSSVWGRSAEMNAAIISQCEAFIGIDSGPAKCASATRTPSLVVWTKHHPAPFHDPADNTTHLVPEWFHRMEPVCNDLEVAIWFNKHYNYIRYKEDGLILEVEKWLEETLK